jgi:hypothetical protein
VTQVTVEQNFQTMSRTRLRVLIDIADGRLSVADTACRIVVGEGRPIGCWTLSGLAARTSDFSEGRRCFAPCGSADAEHGAQLEYDANRSSPDSPITTPRLHRRVQLQDRASHCELHT